MAAYLNRQRKIDLVNMAEEAGLPGLGALKKDEIASVLGEHLDANPHLASSPTFIGYFNRTSSPLKRMSSPLKREPRSSSTALPDLDARPVRSTRGRRAPKYPDYETDIPSTSPPRPVETSLLASAQNFLASTPAAAPLQRALDSIPLPALLPPSPAAVTDLVERQSHILAETASAYWDRAGVTPSLLNLRTHLSSSLSIQATALLLEAYGMQRYTLTRQYTLTLPFKVPLFGNGPLSINYPDFFALLDGELFWGPTVLWALTSLLLPMVAAWFFNLSMAAAAAGRGRRSAGEARRVDPLAFNVAKALLAWLVYERGARLGGLVSHASVAAVEGALPGGYHGVLVGTAIGGLGSLYEAVLARR